MKFKKPYLTLAELGQVFGVSEAKIVRRLTNMNLRTWTSPRFVGAGNGLQGFGELSG